MRYLQPIEMLRWNAFFAVAAIMALAGCSTARVSHFDSFAAAGVKYADIVPTVYDQAFENAVKVDTLVLSEARLSLSQDARLSGIEKSNKNLAERLEILTGLKAHAANLRAYFVALKALAATDAASGITQATKDLTGNLGKLNDNVMKLSVGKLPINDFLDSAVPIVVAQFQLAALDRELKERAAAIEGELSLQQAALSAVAASMRADLEAQFAAQDRDRIVLPYVRQGELPRDWNERRLETFRRRLELAVVDAAAAAAKTLRLSFIALAENRLDEGSISLLLSDLDKVATLIEGIRGKSAGT